MMTIVRFILSTVVLCLLAPLACASEWRVSADDADGMPLVSRGGARVVGSKLAFWGKNWEWAPIASQLRVFGSYDYGFGGASRILGLDLKGRVIRGPENRLQWRFDFNATNPSDAIGGGIVFNFDLFAAAEFGDPTLLSGNAGWSWGKGENRIEMRFEPSVAAVYFEGGRKNEIRVFFYKDRISAGKLSVVATLRVPAGFSLTPTQRERYQLDQTSHWPPVVTDWRTSAVDLSFLNAGEKPAGKRGYLTVNGDRLEFEDGTVARFWGTNLTAQAIFSTPREDVRRQARRLSQLGFNLVRLHHHDSYWVSPNIFGEAKGATDTRLLDSTMLDRIDWWIKCLKDEGIYVWLDLHVQRQLMHGDGIEDFDEIAADKRGGELKGFNYVNRSVVEAMKRFNELFLNHANSYTGRRLKEEPGIAAVLITNENDLTHHYGNSLLPDKNRPRHNAAYMAAAEAFARKHRLPSDRIWRSWEHGPSKLFLNDLEHRFNMEMIAHLRENGMRVPIVTTSSWGGSPLSSLPALNAGDIVDVHAYGGAGQLEADPRHAANLLNWIASAQVVDKPLSVTEWNAEPYPLPERHLLPVYLAAVASHQGWDALMHYAYSQNPLSGPGGASIWETFNDPAYMMTMPAAALLYRRTQVRLATSTRVFALGRDAFFNNAISARNAPALRVASEQGRLLVALPATPELSWLQPSAIPPWAKPFNDPRALSLPSGAVEILSDTGEMLRNWGDGTFVINTPYAQAALGWIGGREFSLADVNIAVFEGHASVIVQSRDGKPIAASRDILITATGVVQPMADNQMPYRRSPIATMLHVRAPEGLRLSAGDAGAELPLTYSEGRYQMKLRVDEGPAIFRLKGR